MEAYGPEKRDSLRGYGVLMGVFGSLASAFATWFRASGRQLPDRIDGRDLLLVTVATHKASRMISKGPGDEPAARAVCPL